jgi:hypothetical protein
MKTKISAKIDKLKVRRIILEGIQKEGKITADYLKSELDGWAIDEKNFEKIVEPINTTIERNRNDHTKIEDFVDDDTIDKILANIRPFPQSNSRFKEKPKYSLSQGNRLMIRRGENLGIQKI